MTGSSVEVQGLSQGWQWTIYHTVLMAMTQGKEQSGVSGVQGQGVTSPSAIPIASALVPITSCLITTQQFSTESEQRVNPGAETLNSYRRQTAMCLTYV